MKKLEIFTSSKPEIKNLFTKYNSRYYLKLLNKTSSNKFNPNKNYVIINNRYWPLKIYYDELPPILNNITPSKHDDKYIYNICSDKIGIHLDSPRYEIVEIESNDMDELSEIRKDIRLLINIVANMNKST